MGLFSVCRPPKNYNTRLWHSRCRPLNDDQSGWLVGWMTGNRRSKWLGHRSRDNKCFGTLSIKLSRSMSTEEWSYYYSGMVAILLYVQPPTWQDMIGRQGRYRFLSGRQLNWHFTVVNLDGFREIRINRGLRVDRSNPLTTTCRE